MAVGAAVSEQSSGEGTTHFGAIRVRINGRGKFRMSVFSLDNLKSKALVPFDMAVKARYSPTRVVNFTEQRVSFEFKTTESNHYFRVNRIVIFTKEIYKSYPGVL